MCWVGTAPSGPSGRERTARGACWWLVLTSHDLSVDAVLPGTRDERKPLLVHSSAQSPSDREARPAKEKCGCI